MTVAFQFEDVHEVYDSPMGLLVGVRDLHSQNVSGYGKIPASVNIHPWADLERPTPHDVLEHQHNS